MSYNWRLYAEQILYIFIFRNYGKWEKKVKYIYLFLLNYGNVLI